MTKNMEMKLQTAQRKMLRSILGKGRSKDEHGILEPWVDWKKKTTHEALQILENLGLPEWVEERRRRKWLWVGDVARQKDGRWTRQILTWSVSGTRARTRPLIRWSDSLQKFAASLHGLDSARGNEGWMANADDCDAWELLQSDNVSFLLGKLDA